VLAHAEKVRRGSVHRGESLPGHLAQVTVAGGALDHDLGAPPAVFQGGDRVAEVRPGQLLPAHDRSAHSGSRTGLASPREELLVELFSVCDKGTYRSQT
jgi:hypothetical protein